MINCGIGFERCNCMCHRMANFHHMLACCYKCSTCGEKIVLSEQAAHAKHCYPTCAEPVEIYTISELE